MTNHQVDLNPFIVALLEAAYLRIKSTTDDLTDEQLYYQPTTDTNSIAWLVWHLSRWKDRISAIISGEPQVWSSEGWAQRWGLPSERTGLGDTPEQVAAFRVARENLFGYMDTAHRATLDRVARLTPEQLSQPIAYLPGNTNTLRPAWQALRGMCSDTLQHTGQIAYLRGMLSGYGWTS